MGEPAASVQRLADSLVAVIEERDRLLEEVSRLRDELNRSRSYRESLEGLPEGTLPRV